MGVAMKVFSSRTATDATEFIGELGRIFYDQDTGDLFLSDGVTPGGNPISGGGSGGGGSYTLPTATATRLGGVKIGANITITNGVISVATPFSGSYNDLSNKPTIPTVPTNVSAFTNDSGYITSSALSSYVTQSYLNGQGYITSSALSSYVTSTSLSSTLTGYVTSSGLISSLTPYVTTTQLTSDLSSYATQSYVNSQGFITSTDQLVNGSYTVALSNKGVLTVPQIYLTGIFADSQNSAGTSGQVLTTTGTGVVWATPSETSLGNLAIDTNTIYPASGGVVVLSNADSGSTSQISIPSPSDTGVPVVIQTNDNSGVQISIGSPTVSFHFTNPALVFPDATAQTTAWTGVGTGSGLVVGQTSPTINSPTITDAVFENTFSIGTQEFFTHTNGFSVNENFDITNPTGSSQANFTGYHFTSGAGKTGVAFTLARTGYFTDGFGITGDQYNNNFVIGSETANTDFVFKTGIGMPFDVSGGTTIFTITREGNLTFADHTVQTTAWTGSVAYSSVIGTPTLATVATTGSYTDLTNKPNAGATLSIGESAPGSDSFWYNTDDGRLYVYDGTEWVDASPQVTQATFSGDYNDLLNIPPNIATIGDIDTAISQIQIPTNWSVNPASGSCPIYVELTPDHFKAYTQQSHLELDNTGYWDIGSNANATGLFSGDSSVTLYSNSGIISLRTGDSSHYFNFGANGVLTLPATLSNGVGGEIVFPSTTTGTQGTINYNADVQGGAFELQNTDGTNTLYLGLILDGQNVSIGNTTASNGGKFWLFNADGSITFPDSTVQATAWSGIDTTTTAPTTNTLWYNPVDGRTYINYNNQWVDANPVVPQATFSGDYNDLINTPTPPDLSQYVTSSVVSTLIAASTSGFLSTSNLSDYTFGSIFIDGEGHGLVVDAGGLKRFGFMKYYGIEGSLVHTVGDTHQVPIRFGRVNVDDVTQATEDNLTTEVYIGIDGKVGINTTSPTEQLSVNGSISLSGSLYFSDATVQATAFPGWQIGSDSQSSPAVLTLDSADSVYAGNVIRRAGTEQWFVGADNNDNFVVRYNASSNLFAVTSTQILLSNPLVFSDTTVQTTAWLGSLSSIATVNQTPAPGTNFNAIVQTDLTNGVSIITTLGTPSLGTVHDWKFGFDGNMTFPDASVQSTAYTTSAVKGLFSVTTNSPGTESLTYSNGVFTFTPKADQTSVTGNAGTATKLATARNINSVSFDGSADISISTLVNSTHTVSLSSSGNLVLPSSGALIGQGTSQVGSKFVISTDHNGGTSLNGNGLSVANISPNNTVQVGWTILFGDGVTTRTVSVAPYVYSGYLVIGFDSNVNLSNAYPVTITSSDYVAATYANVTLSSGSNNWVFNTSGGMVFPDTTTQTTAYTTTAVKGLFSVTTNSASGNGSLSYSSGVFTFTPASVPTYSVTTASASGNGSLSLSGSTFTFTPASVPTSVNINGTAITLGSSGTVTAAAGTLTGTTLNSTVVTSSLTSVGTLSSLSVTSGITVENGDANPNFGKTQITFGYNSTNNYPHWIHTTHNAGSAPNNAIHFYTSDGTQAGVFPTNGVLGLTITNGTISTGAITASGAIAANGGSITSSQTTFSLVNSTPTTVNFAGAATTISIGASTGTTTVNNALTSTGTLSANGSGGITTAQTTFPLVNTTATTVNFAGAATTLNVGYNSTSASTTNISTGAVASSTTKTVNIGTGSASGSTTAVNLGSTSGSSTVTLNGITQIPVATVASNVASTNVINLNTQGQLFSDGNVHLHSSGGSIWINALDGSDVNINTQVNSGVTGGGINVAGAVKSHSRIFDWTAMIHASPASGGSVTGTLLTNASYSNASDGVQLTPNSTNQTGTIIWNVTNFDFSKDFVLEWSWWTSNSGSNPADGVWAWFGGNSNNNSGATQPPSLTNGAIAVRYLTYTNLKTQWYNNGSTTGNAVNFRAGMTYQGEWMTSRIMVRSVGTKRYAYLYTGTSGVCENAIDITSWSASGTWIAVGASTGGNTATHLCCHVALDYL